jgi:hypothetical protein
MESAGRHTFTIMSAPAVAAYRHTAVCLQHFSNAFRNPAALHGFAREAIRLRRRESIPYDQSLTKTLRFGRILIKAYA